MPRIEAYPAAANAQPISTPPASPISTEPSALPPCVAVQATSSPKNIPIHAPEAAPLLSTRPQFNRPVTRSTIIRSTPTMVTSFTGKSLRTRWSTARCASS